MCFCTLTCWLAAGDERGQVGNGMSTTEDESHFTLWAMMSFPLITGHDVRTQSADTLRILTNTEYAKTVFKKPLIHTCDLFAKTGSGQTHGERSKQYRFSPQVARDHGRSNGSAGLAGRWCEPADCKHAGLLATVARWRLRGLPLQPWCV
jgi:hypothetical protein